MRILTVHNYYGQYAPGGEGNVFEAETRLLKAHGHQVASYTRTNAELMRLGLAGRLRLAWNSAWSRQAYRAVQAEIRRFGPDLMHVHNTWMMLSPSIFAAAKELGVATVLTAHNYRLACPTGQFLRNGRVCEDCLGKRPWRAVVHRCYRDSILASWLVYRMSQTNRQRGTFRRDVDAIIALTGFAKEKLAAAGIPHGRIHVKPNFIEDPLEGRKPSPAGDGAVFIGRLSKEKGLSILLAAWAGIDYPLTVVGDGPLRQELEAAAPPNVRFLGWVDRKDVLGLVAQAGFAVLPSQWYEGFPCTLVECMAMGRAVVASRLGAMAEIVADGRTGLLFEPGDPGDLRAKVESLIHQDGSAERMGHQARKDYLENYTAEKNYETLMSIYRSAAGGGRLAREVA
ncbi:MAG: glycosyltransferase family 4 protein [Planctomycetota bacterium]|nr:glycosyltransferase family 4 protein [Planctomycetota bacterium]